MKKYSALLMMMVGLAGLVWASMLGLRMAFAAAPALSVASPKSVAAKDGDEALQRLRGLDQVLAQIDRLKQPAPQGTPGPLAQAAALPPSQSAGAQDLIAQQKMAKKESKPVREAPLVSLVYLSSDMQKAVIDGHLYAAGDRLPDGARLMDISMEQVVLDLNGRRQVLPLARSQVIGSTVKPLKNH